MAEVERPQDEPDYTGKRGAKLARRGHRLLYAIGKIELAMSGLEPVDRLLALNTALENVLHDASGGR